LLAFQLYRYGYTDEAAFESDILVKAVEAAVALGDAKNIYAENHAARKDLLQRAMAKTEAINNKPRAFDKLIHLPGAPIALIEAYNVHSKKLEAKAAPSRPTSAAAKPRPPGRDTLKWKVLYALKGNLPLRIVKPAGKFLKRVGVI